MNLKTQFIKTTTTIALIGVLSTPFLLASCDKIKEDDLATRVNKTFNIVDKYLHDHAVATAGGADVDFSSSTKKEAMLAYFGTNFTLDMVFNGIVFEYIYMFLLDELTPERAAAEAANNGAITMEVSDLVFEHTDNSFKFILTEIVTATSDYIFNRVSICNVVQTNGQITWNDAYYNIDEDGADSHENNTYTLSKNESGLAYTNALTPTTTLDLLFYDASISSWLVDLPNAGPTAMRYCSLRGGANNSFLFGNMISPYDWTNIKLPLD